MKCEKRCQGQEYHCDRCGYTWDMNDPEPPECKTGKQLFLEAAEKLSCKNEKPTKTV